MSESLASEVERIFLDAVDLPPDEREGYLALACVGNAQLRSDVESLLEAAVGSEYYFARLPDRLGIGKLRDPDTLPAAEAGQEYGHYRLTKLLGAGGMGAVWCAERSDGRFEGQVAVKLLVRRSSAGALRGFDREARLLAKLNHPNIASLIDAGVGSDETPYLILEYVEGEPIDLYCDSRKLHIEERLRLFVRVLDAVAHAHTQLIVHSDIKPSNVLVRDDGTVKLLDFGISKLLDEAQAEGDENPARDTRVALTPEFAAPEQFGGGSISTATDVYSLGLLLYVLLSGTSPRNLAGVRSIEQLQAEASREPPSLASTIGDTAVPSIESLRQLAMERGASPQRLLKTLRGELDDVVRKALAVEPQERYPTVADFASDLRRYLRCETVSTLPDTLNYRTQKFVQRHRGGVLTAALTVLALIAATLITTLQSVEARRQRDAAIYQQQRAQATNEFLNFLLEEIGPDGKPMTLLDVADRSFEMLDRQYGTESRFVGRVMYELATPYFSLGKTDKLQTVLASAETSARSSDDPQLLAAILCLRARVALQTVEGDAGQLLAEGRGLLRKRPYPSADAVTSCARAEALVVEAGGDRAGAAGILETALSSIRADAASSSRDELFVLNELANLYFKMGDSTRTIAVNRQFLDKMTSSGRGESLGYVIGTMNSASILQSVGEIKAAHELRLDLFSRIGSLESRGQLPLGLQASYANSLMRMGSYDESVLVFLGERESALSSGNERLAAQMSAQAARTLVFLERYADAGALLDEAEAVFLRQGETNERLIELVRLTRAQLLLGLGQSAAAVALIESELEKKGYPADKSNPAIENTLRIAARIAFETGSLQQAESLASDFHESARAQARAADSSGDVGQALLLRGRVRVALGNTAGAAADLQLALPSLVNGLGDEHPDTIQARRLLDELST